MEQSEIKKPKVLLVEDNAENRDVMVHFLKKICEVDVAVDGPSAVSQAESNHYVLILMDINLGFGMNGIEATKKIRLMEKYREIPIIAVTAYAMAGDKEIFIESGCTHYISKPFTKREFTGLVEKALGLTSQN
ncbi:MAG: response regulator [Ignavibacteriaceae bacterium]|nr:response regulator [Ignavibacteriaceae bacterium]NUM69444.1 response regulator [Ignavibacteriaceae bacterium]